MALASLLLGWVLGYALAKCTYTKPRGPGDGEPENEPTPRWAPEGTPEARENQTQPESSLPPGADPTQAQRSVPTAPPPLAPEGPLFRERSRLDGSRRIPEYLWESMYGTHWHLSDKWQSDLGQAVEAKRIESFKICMHSVTLCLYSC